ncbi:MAG: NADPH:quinone reductase [Pseudomonadota bacterium]
MKAVWYDKLGPAQEVLQFGELPTPEPAPGEVRVRLAASAVNPADANRRAGRMHSMEFPRIVPNSDGAGTVDAVGEGADPTWLGQRVWVYFGQRGRPWGTAAQYICLPQTLVSPLPAGLSFAQGACLGIPCLTAYCSLMDATDLNGRNVLVTGGAGAVGHYAIQLAKWRGAHVIATVSSPLKAEHAKLGGADAVIDYTREDLESAVHKATKGAGIDHIVDVDAGSNRHAVLAMAAPGAIWMSYAIGPDPDQPFPLAGLIRKNITLRGLYLSGLSAETRQRAQQGVRQWLAEVPGGMHAVDSIFPLHETAKAHLMVEARQKRGTVVVSCD